MQNKKMIQLQIYPDKKKWSRVFRNTYHTYTAYYREYGLAASYDEALAVYYDTNGLVAVWERNEPMPRTFMDRVERCFFISRWFER